MDYSEINSSGIINMFEILSIEAADGDGNKATIRLFYPLREKIFNSEFIDAVIQDMETPEENYARIFLKLQLYQFIITEADGKRSDNMLEKRSIFNPITLTEHRAVKENPELLAVTKGKGKSYDAVYGLLTKHYGESGETGIRADIEKAIYRVTNTDCLLTEYGYRRFLKDVLKKTLELWKERTEDTHGKIKKKLFEEPLLNTEDYISESFTTLFADLKAVLKNYEVYEDEYTGEISCPDEGYDLTTEINRILFDLSGILRSCLENRREGATKKKLSELLDYLKKSEALDVKNKIKSLLSVCNDIADKEGATLRLSRECEKVHNRFLSIFSRKLFKHVCDNFSLSKEEKRLYILFNMGLKSLGGVVPGQEMQLVNYILMNSETVSLFFRAILRKEGKGLKEEFERKFQTFLRVSAAWNTLIRENEKSHNKEREYTKRRTYFDPDVITEEGGKGIQNSIDSEILQGGEEQDEDGQNYDIFQNIGPSGREEGKSRKKSLSKINPEKNIETAIQEIDVKDLLEYYLQEDEIRITTLLIQKFPQSEIAKILGVSQPYISNMKKIIEKKLEPVFRKYNYNF